MSAVHPPGPPPPPPPPPSRPPGPPPGSPPPGPPVRAAEASASGPVVVVPQRKGRPGTLPSWWLALVDAVLLIGLGVLCAWPLGAAYVGERWLVAVVAGLTVGVAIAWLSARLRLGAWLTLLTTAAAYLAIGSAVVVPDRARNGVLPTADSLRDLVVGTVHTWRESLTLPVPLAETGTVLIAPLLLGLLGGLVAAILLWRTRRSGLAGLVLAVVLVVACAFGDITAEASLTRGLAGAAIGVVWLRWRAQRHVKARWGRRIAGTLAVVAVAGGAAVGLTAMSDAGEQRVVLRDHVDPPFDPRDYPSPLAKFRYYKKPPVRSGTTLFTVDGLESGTLVRLATMDYYDGIVWNVSGGPGAVHDSGTFRRLRNDPEANLRATHRGTITIGGYTGVWVPSVGETLSMTPLMGGEVDGDAAGELVINRETGTVAQIGGVREGTAFQIDAELPPALSDEEIRLLRADSSVAMPAPKVVPEELVERVERWAVAMGFDGGSDGEVAMFLRDAFRERGYYSDGLDDFTPSGHGFSRLAVLTRTATPVGNAEQYAAAMALIGQQMGLPIRVVIGFKVPPGQGVVRGEHVTAWTEVKFEDVGWVPFDPTPPEDQKLRKPNDEPNEEPQPQVLQPPRIPGEPKEASDNLQQGDGERSNIDLLEVLGTILGIVLDIAKLALLTLPLWGVLLYKFLRRRRRRRAPDATARLTGAWRELSDRMRDLGVRPAPGATRRESAYAAADRYDVVPVVTLAHTADRHVYGTDEPTPEEAQAYWSDVDTALKRIRKETPWWRRVVARFSLASVPWRPAVEHVRLRLARAGRAVGRAVAGLPPVVRARTAVRQRVERRRAASLKRGN
ncbi:transglutaminase superfamily protein [Nocardioides sp. J9]|uniref:transglutaminase domain-containing protein n=1 Tax=Nocardioides sp. J9 TaxID=935844 RepID=UPI0011AB919D|nr:transglutaminase domain-containing protein [Nocardioides sp. J9]TWH01833.1 transglutaminase superfamily protein [Nocardioides sp. J9]